MEFVTVLNIVIRLSDFIEALGRRVSEGQQYRRARFGRVTGEVLYWLGVLDTEAVQRTHFNINLWSAAEALAWRDAYISRCTAISVAAAIFASIGQSALQLNGLVESHWAASALLSASMTLGILSVCAAVALQNAVTALSGHQEIRLWLSRGLADWPRYSGQVYHRLLLESSTPTVKLSAAPQLMLNLSIICYFLGFGLYLLYGWLRNVVQPASNLRNTFIFYVCVLGLVIGYITVLWGGRVLDRDQVNLQFNLKRRFDTGDMDEKMQVLNRWTRIVETLTSTSASESEKTKARAEMEEVLVHMQWGQMPPPERGTIDGSAVGTDQM